MKVHVQIRYEYTKRDFLRSSKTYEALRKYSDDKIQHEQRLAAMAENARAVGIGNFRRLYQDYLADLVYQEFLANPTRANLRRHLDMLP